jgi:hypothetical protein
MRGGRSFLILVIIALGLGAYIYFVEYNREPGDATPKKAKVFTIEPGKIEGLEIHAASGETSVLKKADNKWRMVSPEALEVDDAAVSSVVSTLESLEEQRTIEDSPASAAPFGLETPRFSVSFTMAGDTTPKRLEVGNKTPTGGDLYARVNGQPKIFLISSYLEDSLDKTPFALRDKTVLKFVRDDVDALTLEAPGSPTLGFAKKGTTWRFSTPIDATADFTGVDTIISRIDQARMKAVIAADGTKDLKKYGLDKPQATAILGAGSTKATLVLGAKMDDTTIYARDLSRPMVFTVESSLLDELKKKADDLRKKDIAEFRSFSATAVDATLGGETVSFEKQKPASADQASAVETWKQTKPTAKDADQTKLTDFLTTMSNLRADKFADTPLPGADDLVLTVKSGDASAPKTETIRFRKSKDVVQAILAGEAGAAIVTTADYEKGVALLKELAGIK